MRYLLFLSIACLGFVASQAQSWEVYRMAPMPMKVSNNAVCEGDSSFLQFMYSFGGIDSTKAWSGITRKSFRYNMNWDVWDTIAPLPDTLGKIASGASNVDGMIYILGGYHVLQGGGEVSSNRVHRYDPINNVYLPDGANIPVPIDDHVQAVWRDSLIYVITGWSNSGNVPNVQVYNPSLDSWGIGTSTPNNHIYKSFGASGTIVGDTIYYFGGASSGGFNFPAQSGYRKGAIDTTNPLNIAWTDVTVPGEFAYRSTVITSKYDDSYWVGGSNVTYNYNGIAYNGSGGVLPRDTMLLINKYSTFKYVPFNNDSVPMDLRGAARMDDDHWYICGGMEGAQKVTDATIQLVYHEIEVGTSDHHLQSFHLLPNPTSGKLSWGGKTLDRVKIFSLQGSLEMERLNVKEIDLGQLSAGVYIATIDCEGASIRRKIVVQ